MSGLFERNPDLFQQRPEPCRAPLAIFDATELCLSNSLEIIDLIINYLTENGAMELGRLYESPFTDLNPLGVEGLFKPAEITDLFTVLNNIRSRRLDREAGTLRGGCSLLATSIDSKWRWPISPAASRRSNSRRTPVVTWLNGT
jgi:hypothetical protein